MKIGVIAFSNSLSEHERPVLEKFKSLLLNANNDVCFSNYLFGTQENLLKPSELAKKKAFEANEFIQSGVKVLLDISGGDSANLVLEFLNFDLISQNQVKYFGYSDNSVILNSIYSQTKSPSFYYCPRMIAEDETGQQLDYFSSRIIDFQLNNPTFKYEFLRGDFLDGEVLGGNLRCSLKIAGTKFSPDFENKILFLESLGGDQHKVSSYLHTFYMLGVFDKI
jgi:muramoyltetrapeptide carboxypeptidase LdcA involved in peptidoglycan recycling